MTERIVRMRARRHRRRRGNALILALLALVVAGLTAATALQSRRLEAKRESGLAEASVLAKLRDAVQSAMLEHLTQIQQGLPIDKGTEQVTPVLSGERLIWRPSVVQLRAMGYLPDGWSATSSTVNGAAYDIAFERTPVGCVAAACEVEGRVVIMRPITDAGAVVDGVVIGPILTRAGADGGVSLGTSPSVITGFGGTWTLPNPVPGSPPGVVAMRVGTQAAGLSQFVRIGDSRDPVLAGNLSSAGNLTIGGAASVQGDTTLNGNLQSLGPGGGTCLQLDRSGVITVSCAGTLNAQTGVFTGGVNAAGGLTTRNATLFDDTDPNGIRVNGGEMFIRGPLGTLVTFRDGNISAQGSVGGSRLALTPSAVEGAACSLATADPSTTSYGSAIDGSLAACLAGRWLVVSRLGQLGGACPVPGLVATDTGNGAAMVCRGGRYLLISALLSNFVLIDTLALSMATSPIQVTKPPCEIGAIDSEALIILTPNNEDAAFVPPATLSGVNRYAVDLGSAWEIRLQRSSDNTAIAGNLIASVYCYYGK